MYLSPATNINFFFFPDFYSFYFCIWHCEKEGMWGRGVGGGRPDSYSLWYRKRLIRMLLNWEIPVATTLAFSLLKAAQVDPKSSLFFWQPSSYKTEAVMEASDGVWRTALRSRYIPTPAWVLQNPIFHFNQSEDRIRPWLIAEYEKYIYCAFCPMYPLVLLSYNNMEIKIHCVCKIGFPTNSVALKIKMRFPG